MRSVRQQSGHLDVLAVLHHSVPYKELHPLRRQSGHPLWTYRLQTVLINRWPLAILKGQQKNPPYEPYGGLTVLRTPPHPGGFFFCVPAQKVPSGSPVTKKCVLYLLPHGPYDKSIGKQPALPVPPGFVPCRRNGYAKSPVRANCSHRASVFTSCGSGCGRITQRPAAEPSWTG